MSYIEPIQRTVAIALDSFDNCPRCRMGRSGSTPRDNERVHNSLVRLHEESVGDHKQEAKAKRRKRASKATGR